MKTTFYSLFTLLFVFSNFVGISQTLLEGTITDFDNGAPIELAVVSIYNNEHLISQTNTDENGKYIFEEIPSQAYDIQTSHTNYIQSRKTTIILKPNQTNTFNTTLKKQKSIELKLPPQRSIPYINNLGSNELATLSKSNTKLYKADYIHEATTSHIQSGILPTSGQITVGEWNDLHNWKDWLHLLQNEEYSIMNNRFEIYPTQRYSVLVINESKHVLPNTKVALVDSEGNTVWQTRTDNTGKAELWARPFTNVNDAKTYHIKVNQKKISKPIPIEEGSNTVILSRECYNATKMDIVFTVDATSSMNDEIQYLKSELLDVIHRIQKTNTGIDYRTGSVFYRDTNDDYLTRISPISSNAEELITFVTDQDASGGGDKPEAVDVAMEETLNLNWDRDALKINFLLLDAPPHEDDDTMSKIRSQIKKAAEKGIKIIPITASGIGRETEFLMKFMAIMTNGTYVFITDDSGIGEEHLAPVVSDYEVEKLNDCMVRLITEYSKSYSCNERSVDEERIDVNVYPNPSTQFINVDTETIASEIKLLSSSGMVVKAITPIHTSTRIEMEDLINGVYTLAIYIGDKVITKQIILLK